MSTVLDHTGPPAASGVLAGLARRLTNRRRLVLLLAALAVIGAALAGLGVERHLSSGGFTPDSAQSAVADRILAQRFGAGAPNVVLVVHRPGAASTAGRALTQRIAATPGVVYAESFWTTGQRTLLSRDGRTALILVKIGGDAVSGAATSSTS